MTDVFEKTTAIKIVTVPFMPDGVVYVGLPMLPGDEAVDWAEVGRLIHRYETSGEPVSWSMVRTQR